MPIHAIATVDLDGGVSSVARQKFNQYLADKGFVKHKLTTLWTISFKLGATKEGVKSFMRKHVDDAAAHASIWKYEALFSVSDEPAIEWEKSPKSTLLGGYASR